MAVKTPLKWVGSKARLMPKLRQHLPDGKRLVEPFAGSCAVMMNTDYDEYLIADVNPDLVNLYKVMAYHTDALLNELEILFNAGSVGDEENRAVFYYAVRDAFNQSGKSFGSESVEAAARFLYLNRHCFNGLCRYNRRCHFNVPFGKYKSLISLPMKSAPLLRKRSAQRSLLPTMQKRSIWFGTGMLFTAIRLI